MYVETSNDGAVAPGAGADFVVNSYGNISCVTTDSNPETHMQMSWVDTDGKETALEVDKVDVTPGSMVKRWNTGVTHHIRKIFRYIHGYTVVCRVTHVTLQEPKEFNYTIGVEYPPIIQPLPNTAKANRGKPFEYTCNGDANPLPNYIWYKNNVTFQSDQTLTLDKAEERDIGIYMCSADNRFEIFFLKPHGNRFNR
ncbi:PREDICTED: myelin-associated glycoprotein-like [Priapulus caudatus]|uniref:Myelin-associated glycoprotein-like n=1 Tax=Priapulus caudatus TaxID=37621 RepID=A0ABM1EEQ2_PRICU|nr:PREDICTED: myelin-associated glycoprotein-like [Priapulus caudatus]